VLLQQRELGNKASMSALRSRPDAATGSGVLLMRRSLFADLSVAVIVGVVGSISPAEADRYCLQGRDWGYPGNCQFWSYQQCMASASGTSAYCGVNPRYAYERRRQDDWRGY
jgi:hypothetical protein